MYCTGTLSEWHSQNMPWLHSFSACRKGNFLGSSLLTTPLHPCLSQPQYCALQSSTTPQLSYLSLSRAVRIHCGPACSWRSVGTTQPSGIGKCIVVLNCSALSYSTVQGGHYRKVHFLPPPPPCHGCGYFSVKTFHASLDPTKPEHHIPY